MKIEFDKDWWKSIAVRHVFSAKIQDIVLQSLESLIEELLPLLASSLPPPA
jgi:hypothetical protein